MQYRSPKKDLICFFMDKNLQQAKLEMWTKKLAENQAKLEDAMKRKGEAAQMGDLSENAAYKMAIEEIEMAQAREREITNILENIKKNLGITD